ncbi:MAG: hypothetical protein ACREP7_04465 [Lysobacter sp.]
MKPLQHSIAFAACCVFFNAYATAPTLATTTPHDLPPAPWNAAALPANKVPAVYLSEWKKAKNRGRCAPLALSGAEQEAGIKLRRANFSDGWAVAFDALDQRSAFGVAGTGLDIEPVGGRYSFPYSMSWSDGSSAHYGLNGDTGPGYLAYLEVAGQRCLYNVWSERGKAHLEQLLRSLRRVRTP